MNAGKCLLITEIYNLKDYCLRVLKTREKIIATDKDLKNIYIRFEEASLQPFLNSFNFNSFKETTDYKNKLKELFNFLENILNFCNLSTDQEKDMIKLLNGIYLFVNDIHKDTDPENTYGIQGPRQTLIFKTEDYEDAPFAIDYDHYIESKNNHNVISFNEKKENLHYELIDQCKESIACKDYEDAYQYIKRANELYKTAESLTLLGWTHSFLGEIEEAKECCLDAITLDPDYGNAYNDLGSYLFSEKKYNQAIHWLEKAKVAVKYANREFPYLNLGKIYILQKEFEKAKTEFLMAKSLAPDNREIYNILLKLDAVLQNESRPVI